MLDGERGVMLSDTYGPADDTRNTHVKEQPEEQSVEIAGQDREIVVCGGCHPIEDRCNGVQQQHCGAVCNQQANYTNR